MEHRVYTHQDSMAQSQTKPLAQTTKTQPKCTRQNNMGAKQDKHTGQNRQPKHAGQATGQMGSARKNKQSRQKKQKQTTWDPKGTRHEGPDAEKRTPRNQQRAESETQKERGQEPHSQHAQDQPS